MSASAAKPPSRAVETPKRPHGRWRAYAVAVRTPNTAIPMPRKSAICSRPWRLIGNVKLDGLLLLPALLAHRPEVQAEEHRDRQHDLDELVEHRPVRDHDDHGETSNSYRALFSGPPIAMVMLHFPRPSAAIRSS